jgi:uncharacterized protein (DUF302 family)
MPVDGLKVYASGYGHKETLDRFKADVTSRGMIIFADIDHAAGAGEVGLKLRPTRLIIFGNAKAGTPLMQADQAIGIDLPLKALIHEDEAGHVWLSIYDPIWIARRHHFDSALKERTEMMSKALDDIAAKVTIRS